MAFLNTFLLPGGCSGLVEGRSGDIRSRAGDARDASNGVARGGDADRHLRRRLRGVRRHPPRRECFPLATGRRWIARTCVKKNARYLYDMREGVKEGIGTASRALATHALRALVVVPRFSLSGGPCRRRRSRARRRRLLGCLRRRRRAAPRRGSGPGRP